MLYPDKNINFPYVFVADEAYALSINMMKLFARTALIGNERKIFNYRLSRVRMIVECVFGMMVKIYSECLIKLVHPDETKSIDLACCGLYKDNFIRKREGNLAEVYVELLTLTADEEPRIPRARASKAAYRVRETYVIFFSSPKSTGRKNLLIVHSN